MQKIRYWCQDETRVGLKTIEGRKITLKGVKPVGQVEWQRLAYYIYGLVEPQTGASFFYEFSHLDSECFEIFLRQFSQANPQDLHIVQLDNGAFHKAKTLEIPNNIILLFQPARSPELNPIERVWLHLKSFLKWGCFITLEELRVKVRKILNSFTDKVIASLTGWEYIIHALSVAGI